MKKKTKQANGNDVKDAKDSNRSPRSSGRRTTTARSRSCTSNSSRLQQWVLTRG